MQSLDQVGLDAGLNKIADRNKIKGAILRYSAVSACLQATPLLQNLDNDEVF